MDWIKSVLHNFWFKLDRDEKAVVLIPILFIVLMLICAVA